MLSKLENIVHRYNLYIMASIILFITTLYLLFSFHNKYIDDVYITLSYVSNFSQNLQWGMYKDIPANSATSPGNVIILSLITFISGDPESSVLILNIVYLILLFITSKFISQYFQLNSGFYLYVPLLIILNPFLFSSLGLESFGIIIAFLIFFYNYSVNNAISSGVVLGFLYLLRPDSIILTIPLYLVLRSIKFYFLHLLSFLIIIVPWLFFSYFQFGSIFPDTLIIKKIQKSWGEYDFVLVQRKKQFSITNIS